MFWTPTGHGNSLEFSLHLRWPRRKRPQTFFRASLTTTGSPILTLTTIIVSATLCPDYRKSTCRTCSNLKEGKVKQQSKTIKLPRFPKSIRLNLVWNLIWEASNSRRRTVIWSKNYKKKTKVSDSPYRAQRCFLIWLSTILGIQLLKYALPLSLPWKTFWRRKKSRIKIY